MRKRKLFYLFTYNFIISCHKMKGKNFSKTMIFFVTFLLSVTTGISMNCIFWRKIVYKKVNYSILTTVCDLTKTLPV